MCKRVGEVIQNGNTSWSSAVDFTIVVPDDGAQPTVTVDPQVPGGLVTLDYPDYRITEFAAPPGEAPFAKFVDRRTRVEPTTVRGTGGY